MSSLALFTQAEPDDFSALSGKKKPAAVLQQVASIPRLASVTPASRLQVRPAPRMVSSGIGEIDALTGGLPCGCLSELCGSASSGRTSVLLAALAAATGRQEVCALVDTTDAFDPLSAAAAGVDFSHLLWVRCGAARPAQSPPARHAAGQKKNPWMDAIEQALRVTDLLLQSGGFGMVAMDLGDVPFPAARRIPLTTWFRFQRAVENTPTVLFLLAQSPIAATCAAQLLRLRGGTRSALSRPRSAPPHAQILEEWPVDAELVRARLERKPAQSTTAVFATQAVRIS